MLYVWKLARESFEESKDWLKLIRIATNPDEVNVRKIKDKDGNVRSFSLFHFLLTLYAIVR
jgi:hypothetical protein